MEYDRNKIELSFTKLIKESTTSKINKKKTGAVIVPNLA